MQSVILECKNLHKWYSGVHALRGVSLDIFANEAVGLVGDNGAGKSTLINILSGTQVPDDGELYMDQRPLALRKPKDAMDKGIETIYQYNSMVPTMSIARNIFIGREPLKFAITALVFSIRKKCAPKV